MPLEIVTWETSVIAPSAVNTDVVVVAVLLMTNVSSNPRDDTAVTAGTDTDVVPVYRASVPAESSGAARLTPVTRNRDINSRPAPAEEENVYVVSDSDAATGIGFPQNPNVSFVTFSVPSRLKPFPGVIVPAAFRKYPVMTR